MNGGIEGGREGGREDCNVVTKWKIFGNCLVEKDRKTGPGKEGGRKGGREGEREGRRVVSVGYVIVRRRKSKRESKRERASEVRERQQESGRGKRG